jgi:hypothetical protein
MAVRGGGIRWWRAGVILGVIAIVVAPGSARAQVPPTPPDTVARDTVVVDTAGAAADSVGMVRDTVAAADTLRPVDVVHRFPRGAAPSWRAGVWEWDRAALHASGATTLTDLLEGIPGVHALRFGLDANPEALNAWGMGGGRLEVVLDGFVLDPLDAGTFDLSRLELAAVEGVRVERRAGRLRIEVETIAPTKPEPYSIVEVGTGEPDNAKMLRGAFQTPRVLGGPFSVALDRIDSDGLGRAEPANTFATWLKWGRVVGSTALQLELRRASFDRQLADRSVVDGSRRDWVLRARGRPLDGVTTEMYLGRSSIDEAPGASGRVAEGEGADERVVMSSVQAGARAAIEADRFWSQASVRLRSHAALPMVETELTAGVRPFDPIELSGVLSWSDWRKGGGAGAYGARAELGPFLGLRPFAEVSGGRRGVPFLFDAEGRSVLTEQNAVRLGGDFQRGGLHLGGAFVSVSADSVAAYGLPFDREFGLFPGGDASGWEVTARIPLFWEALAIEGWYARWTDSSPWIYTPGEAWRAGLVYSHSPLPSGNLDILARLEGHHRGAMAVPTGVGETTIVPGKTVFDFYLQIRVIDVRAFLRWENMFLRPDLQDFPDRTFPRQRLYYGVKWEFWN